MTLASIPSPTTAVWDLGPVPVRAYALFIVLGIVLACVVTELRLRARGAPRWAVLDIAVWAVPFGIVGARLYHVITSPDRFFGEDGELAAIIRVWEGGLGIWGAIAGGALGAWLACRQLKLPFLMVADAAAVGIPLAQAVGRIGNWFNNELYGAETTLPWGLEVHRMVNGQAVPDPVTGESALPGLYHPTFLYEALWCVGVAVLVWLVGKQLRLGAGRQFALYVMAYTAGRAWIEMLRIDDTSEVPVPGAADTVMTVLGLRVNVWVAAGVFLAALVYFIMVRGPQEFLVQRAEGEGFEVVTEEEFRAHQAAAGDPEVAAETHGGPPGQRDAATAESSEPTSPGPDRD
ncbi:prolipoprotein diacylglyceryl transferase [Natronosporangium hydrolyticum]|uniref:prolipoprotein diacylglyceryl transferase n=1 Tax=Natronosporangium hydrolyticum TaxID=2811111 RepID=UPI001EFA1357|nr:prolipoprotein diacylglyceryl transferase [Natronosporangium hydrolyticum]